MNFDVSLSVFDIPRSHHHCTLNNFEFPSQAVRDAVSEFLACLDRGEAPHLLATGPPGLGKTHLAVALYRWGVLHWGTVQSAFVQVPEFFHTVKEFSDEYDPFTDVVGAKRLLVLDDLLGRVPSPWELDNVVFRLINTAHVNCAAMVVTTNQTIDQIAQVLKPHEVSRLLQDAVHIEFSGEDRRL